MTAGIYWLIALIAYCFFTYFAVLSGGVARGIGHWNDNDTDTYYMDIGEPPSPWFVVWLVLGPYGRLAFQLG